MTGEMIEWRAPIAGVRTVATTRGASATDAPATDIVALFVLRLEGRAMN
jgi:hypothetical protein